MTEFGFRPLNCWGSGNLPAPWAVGDVLDIPPGAKALERMRGMSPGRYRIVCAFSIDEGDAWYFRVAALESSGPQRCSDRLHVISDRPERVSTEISSVGGVNWLKGCRMVDKTVDPKGLALRQRMLRAGWSLTPRDERTCPTCSGSGRIRSEGGIDGEGS